MTYQAIFIKFTASALICFSAAAQEIKFSEYIEPLKYPDDKESVKPAVKPGAQKGGFPLQFGMSSKQVLALLGDPTGQVVQGDKLTYSFSKGYVEFIQDKVAKIKWEGKYYSQQSKPELARETAGTLEIRKAARTRPSKVIKASGSQKALGTKKGPPPKIRVIKGSSDD